MQVKVREKGQMTLPKEVREEIGLNAGESLTVLVVDGEIRMRPTRGVTDRLFGSLKPYAKRSFTSYEDEDRALEEAILEDWTETLKRM